MIRSLQLELPILSSIENNKVKELLSKQYLT